MKKHLFAAAIAFAVMPALSAADSDPVLLTVDGHDIHVSEFEYLYNKNNSQQANPQSLDEYLKMFIDYKLKVADAEHAGLQNDPAFVYEFSKYRRELALPYLRSKSVEDSLINEAYKHHLNDVYVSHIMLPLENDGEQKLDSIRSLIVSGKSTFEDEARRNSVDRGSSPRGGLMGFVIPDRFPWAFEKMAYDTPLGQVSPVVNSGMGYHIIRVESITPASGEVEASHILLATRGKSPEEAVAAQARIDSLYNVAVAGGDFAELAKKYSEDPGSAKNGGALGFFPRGAMVAEFDSVSFALKDGEISKPFKTSFGYHIIKRTNHHDIPSFEQLRPAIIEAMKQDERATAPNRARVNEIVTEYDAQVNDAAVEAVAKKIAAAAAYDSTLIASLLADNTPVATFKGGKVTVADVIKAMPQGTPSVAEVAAGIFSGNVDGVLKEAVVDEYRNELERTNPDYRNLVNEYRDGILLFDISNRNVWEKAAKDPEGLDAFFKANAAKYAWEKPKFKSYIIFATSDSILNEATKFADTLDASEPSQFVKDMRAKFGREIKVERVIAAQGENAITDYLAFGGEKPEATSNKWVAYAAYKGRIIDAPENAADVRGAAVTDYQAKLDADWLGRLHKQYKVKVNKKVFENLKKTKK